MYTVEPEWSNHSFIQDNFKFNMDIIGHKEKSQNLKFNIVHFIFKIGLEPWVICLCVVCVV